VFQIIDEKFKRKIKNDWTKDLPLMLINKRLVEFEGDK